MSQSSQQETDLGLFLQVLENHDVEPNFWCSEEYFQKAGFQCVVDGLGYVGVLGDGVLICPPIHPVSGPPRQLLNLFSVNEVWSDFQGSHFPDWVQEDLDLEYIYNPKEILAMEGSRFKTFRKNHRKVQRDYGAESLIYNRVGLCSDFQEDIDQLFIEWLESRGESEIIHDDSVLYRYLTEGYNRALLYHQEHGLLGINVWDENYKYVNYRYMICRPWPYLDEYMRWLFYAFLDSDKLVNDGGVLDNPGLKRFKDRMNPTRVRNVHSWRKS